jgi:hypothetical protein
MESRLLVCCLSIFYSWFKVVLFGHGLELQVFSRKYLTHVLLNHGPSDYGGAYSPMEIPLLRGHGYLSSITKAQSLIIDNKSNLANVTNMIASQEETQNNEHAKILEIVI